jgi:hypothetical protein
MWMRHLPCEKMGPMFQAIGEVSAMALVYKWRYEKKIGEGKE